MTNILISEQQLTAVEQSALRDLEATIQRGLDTFVEVGNALMEIRDKRLYRAEFSSFETYCNTRWEFSKRRANQLIGAAQVIHALGTIVPTFPQNESQARPLTKLPPERRAEAWQKAVATAQGEVTAEHVQKVVDEMRGLAGRFDNKLWYWVDTRNEVIYNRAETDRNHQWSRDNRFDECTLVEGKELNRDKLYDSYPLVDPLEPVGPDMDSVLPRPGGATHNPWSTYYPVHARKQILYLDPHTETERHQALRYKGCSWLTWSDIQNKWRSYTLRLCEYHLQPPEPAIVWQTDNADFGPDARAVCEACSGRGASRKVVAYAFAQWKPSERARVWFCPKGHLTEDLEMQILQTESVIEGEIVEEEDVPTNACDEEQDPSLDPDEAEAFDEHDLDGTLDQDEDPDEAENASEKMPPAATVTPSPEQPDTPQWLTYVEHLSTLVATMKATPEAIESALTADALKAYEAQWGMVSAITPEGIEAAWILLALHRPLPDTSTDIGLAKIQTFSPALASFLVQAMQDNERLASHAAESLKILIDSYAETRKSLSQATELLRQVGYARVNGSWEKAHVR